MDVYYKLFLVLLGMLTFSPSYSSEKAEGPPTTFLKLNPLTISLFSGDSVSKVFSVAIAIETNTPDQVTELTASQPRIESTLGDLLRREARTFSRSQNDYAVIKKLLLDQCLKEWGKDKIKDVLILNATLRKN